MNKARCRSNLEQQFADLVFALGSSFMQRRELPQVGHVDRGSVSDQQLSHLVVTVRTGVMQGDQTAAKSKVQKWFSEIKNDEWLASRIFQWHFQIIIVQNHSGFVFLYIYFHVAAEFNHMASVAPFVLGVHVGPVVQEVLHHWHSVVASSKVKRSGVSSLQISAIHILSRTQRLRRERQRQTGRWKHVYNLNWLIKTGTNMACICNQDKQYICISHSHKASCLLRKVLISNVSH